MMRSIFSKILASHIAVILISTFTITLLMSFLIRSHAIENKRQDLLQKGEVVVSLLTPAIQAGRLPNDDTMRHISDLVGGMAYLVDANGNVVCGRAPRIWPRRFRANQEAISGLFSGERPSWARVNRRLFDRLYIVVAFPIASPSPLALVIDDRIEGVTETIDALQKLLIYSLVTGIALAIFLGLIISRSVTRPIADISHAALAFAKGHYNSRTLATGSDEVGRLGQTFNTMAESLSQIEQNRQDFLANVTHELKTPVASIQALSEAIIDGLATSKEQQHRYLNSIVQECRRISRLVQDLLDLSQLEAGELSIHPVPINLTQYLREETDKFHALFQEKQLALALSVPANLPKVAADVDRLAQIISNLISNAVRYSPENSPLRVSAKLQGHFVSIAIQDMGPGIPAEALPHIWDRFYRVDNSRSRKGGGTGLGLAITKKLVEAMGGEITVSCEENKGTVFAFTLPISKGDCG